MDLNRNFLVGDWQPSDTLYRWNSRAEKQDVVLSSGAQPASEPETRALCDLIEQPRPAWIATFHGPLACIDDDPQCSSLGHWLADRMNLPRVSSPGYDTPGSFGSWCVQYGRLFITAELPPVSADEASEKYLATQVALLRWQPGQG